MRYRIVLCGFSEFEYRAMRFSFQHPVGPAGSQRYDVVDALAEADFAVVDADSRPAVKGVLQTGSVARSVFVGGAAPAGAVAHLQRPIDTNRILRALDELVAARGRMPSPAAGAVGSGRPPAAPPPLPSGPPSVATRETAQRVASPAAPAPSRRHSPAPELPTLSEVVVDPYAFIDSLGQPSSGAGWTSGRRLDAALYEADPAPTAAAADGSASGQRPGARAAAAWPTPPGAASGASTAAAWPSPGPMAAPPGSPLPTFGRRSFDASSVSASAGRGTAAVLPPEVDTPTAEAQGAAKAAARAKARRARFASSRAAGVEPLRDVLVVGPDEPGNLALCTLLERFGFRPVVVSTPLQAHQFLAERQPALAAVFLDLPLDDGGLALLQRIRALPTASGHSEASVHLVAAAVEPADRVRVALARLPEPMIKPLARGGVARALERSGVPFPADARRH